MMLWRARVAGRRRTLSPKTALVVGVSTALVATSVVALVVQIRQTRLSAQAIESIHGTPVVPLERPADLSQGAGAGRAATSWPAGGSVEAAVGSGATFDVGGLGVRVSSAGAAAAAGTLSRVEVTVLSREQTPPAWQRGVLLRVGRDDGGSAAAPVGPVLSVSYSGLNSVLPCCSVNGDSTISMQEDGIHVDYTGDDYPNFEVVQYRPGKEPRDLGRDRAGWAGGLNAMPPAIDRSYHWVNGECRTMFGCD